MAISQSRTLFTMKCPDCKDEGVVRVEYLGLITETLCECRAGQRLEKRIERIVAHFKSQSPFAAGGSKP